MANNNNNNNNNKKPTSKQSLIDKAMSLGQTFGQDAASTYIPGIKKFIQSPQSALDNITSTIGFVTNPVGYMADKYIKPAVQGIVSNTVNPSSINQSQFNQLTPQQKNAYDAMMAEKASGGSGNIAANQHGLQLPGRTSKIDENVAAFKDGELMAPGEGLTFDDSNAVQLDDTANASAEGEAPILRGTEATDNNAVANAILNAGSNTNNADSTTDEMIKQLMSTDGYITPQQMQEMIKGYYSQARDVINQNPLYGGEYVQPRGYQFSQRAVENLGMADYLAGRTGENSYAQQYMDMNRRNYNASMANRAGVPYEDYVKGMAERNVQDVLLRAKEVEQQLTNYANQTNDMKVKLAVAQKLQENRINTQAELDKIYANYIADSNLERIKGDNAIRQQLVTNMGNLDVRNAQDTASLIQKMYEMNHPATTMKAFGSMAGSLALLFYQDPTQAANFLSAMAPQYHKALFGKVMNPKDMRDVFTAQQMVKQNPSAFEDFLNKYNVFNRGQ